MSLLFFILAVVMVVVGASITIGGVTEEVIIFEKIVRVFFSGQSK